MKTLPQLETNRPFGPAGDVGAILWPNGEIAIWRQKKIKVEPLKAKSDRVAIEARMARLRLHLLNLKLSRKIEEILGLSTLPIFDSSFFNQRSDDDGTAKPRAEKGKRGITAYGKRMVRNAAYLLENLGGRARCIFATCTIPGLPEEQIRIIQENWGEVVERYRLLLKRRLQNQGLSGEVVTVSEIQEKRYEKTGLPVLHLHSVFVGITRWGRYAINVKDHDDMWTSALNVAVNIPRNECSNGCQLKRVHKSASAYLGKYLSKGTNLVDRVVADGRAHWLPDHWWNCSRSLRAKVKADTRRVDFLADWLNHMAEIGAGNIWEWHREIILENDWGYPITIARYGRLTNGQNAQIRAALP